MSAVDRWPQPDVARWVVMAIVGALGAVVGEVLVGGHHVGTGPLALALGAVAVVVLLAEARAGAPNTARSWLALALCCAVGATTGHLVGDGATSDWSSRLGTVAVAGLFLAGVTGAVVRAAFWSTQRHLARIEDALADHAMLLRHLTEPTSRVDGADPGRGPDPAAGDRDEVPPVPRRPPTGDGRVPDPAPPDEVGARRQRPYVRAGAPGSGFPRARPATPPAAPGTRLPSRPATSPDPVPAGTRPAHDAGAAPDMSPPVAPAPVGTPPPRPTPDPEPDPPVAGDGLEPGGHRRAGAEASPEPEPNDRFSPRRGPGL